MKQAIPLDIPLPINLLNRIEMGLFPLHISSVHVVQGKLKRLILPLTHELSAHPNYNSVIKKKKKKIKSDWYEYGKMGMRTLLVGKWYVK